MVVSYRYANLDKQPMLRCKRLTQGHQTILTNFSQMLALQQSQLISNTIIIIKETKGACPGIIDQQPYH
jgi:hypothetical protein